MLTLVLNNILSFVVMMLCWWNAHEAATSGTGRGRLLAIGYGLFGFVTLTVAMFRTLSAEMDWFPLAGKTALILLLVLLLRRRA